MLMKSQGRAVRRADAAPRDPRRRARDLRRRLPDHTGVHHRRDRDLLPRPAHARPDTALDRARRRAPLCGLRRRPARPRAGCAGRRVRLGRRGDRLGDTRAATAAGTMSEPAIAITFVDHAHDVHGTARSGLTLIFEGRSATSHADGPVVEAGPDGWHAELAGKLELEFAPVGGAAIELGDARVHVCSVTGQAAGTRIEGFGSVTETLAPPRWEEL